MSPASNLGRKIIPPWRAITANLLPGSPSNWLPEQTPLDTSRAVKEELNRLSAYFPASLKTVYPYDTTPFIKISIQEVFKTLVEAIILVFLVMYLFLQNFRATIIPTIAVPVVILGTFAILSAVGFTINTLTMFGMVLAIGLLVDDAIVVVENVERVIAEDKLPPKEATHKSMGADPTCAGRDCRCSFRSVYADGLYERCNRGDLPPVLHHADLLHAAFSICGNEPDPLPCAPPF